ncbi:neutral zinc metallopeptidase [Nocardia farcinica]|uniref:neutral zinc metallopeptidase n=1 Tax=Nocardia farcinica TaxID=37329 RepID=UPI001893FF5B|nr:neutral zinc metallopeptidase [Nocardia farcinica]MBF6068519.1 neutral zinc metallopeptidase [Nocardia farcinica]MBF6229657.1 neutral zinc metallopeptidase [Nocardia farcinica]MBF6440416.1 neutral zinc metallopeptidase [Nocardia farcinica]MBF6519938.1 neutral zinc metallopeptidase [Nocardia farcinica]
MTAVVAGTTAIIRQQSSTPASAGAGGLPTFPAASATRTVPVSTTQRGPQHVAALGDHPISTDANTGLAAIACDYAPWGASASQARRFYESALACMNSAWETVMLSKILPFSEPALEVPEVASSVSSPCTNPAWQSDPPPAYYCPTNHTIYMPMDTIGIDEFGDDAVIYLGILAHEYGHHVQAISGITSEAQMKRWIFGAGTGAELEMSRRLELQAQCFAGMFFTAAYQTMSHEQYTRAVKDMSNRGDHPGFVRDHGSPANNALWVANGSRNRLAECNTWIAVAGAVA